MAGVLFTGLPGHGKTLLMLRWVETVLRKPVTPGMPRRPVFFHGIELTDKLDWKPFDPKDWQTLPAGSIFVIDEAQLVFPVRGRGEPDEWIARLTTHRHLGLDFVLVTQHPMLIDGYVRRLLERHFHIKRAFGFQSCNMYECVSGIREYPDKSVRDLVLHGPMRYPKEVYAWYRSAELHTVKTRLPARVWLMLAAPVVFMVVAWLAWSKINPRTNEILNGAALPATGAVGPGVAGPPPTSQGRQASLSPAEFVARHVPRVAGLAYTAPVYDDVTKPVMAPYPAACVASATRCGCYSQQGTRLEVPEDLCRRIADGGFFVAWERPAVSAVALKVAPAPSPLEPEVGLSGFMHQTAGTQSAVKVPPDEGAPPGRRAPFKAR